MPQIMQTAESGSNCQVSPLLRRSQDQALHLEADGISLLILSMDTDAFLGDIGEDAVLMSTTGSTLMGG